MLKSYKKIAILLLCILPIILLSLPGCESTEISPTPTISASPTETTPTPTESPNITPSPTPDMSPQPTKDYLGRSLTINPPPKLGQTAELTFTLGTINPYDFSNRQSLVNARAWVEFYWTNTQGSYSEAKKSVPVPLSEVLVSGNLSWEGNALTTSSITLHSTIQLPREGVWKIMGFFSGEGWSKPADYRIMVAVTKDAAAIMGATDFKSSPVAYLGNFSYGLIGTRTLDEITAPVIVELDISKAPRVGEEAILNCRITSLHDVPDFSAKVNFFKDGIKTSGDNLLVQGSLEWFGDLKHGQPVELSASIKFPEEGNWEIRGGGNSLENEANHRGGYADILQITIEDDLSFFGFRHDHEKPSTISGAPYVTATPIMPPK